MTSERLTELRGKYAMAGTWEVAREAIKEYAKQMGWEDDEYMSGRYGIISLCLKDEQAHFSGDTPAVLMKDGTREYWVEGKRHRGEGKPAIERRNGTKEYWIEGVRVG